MAIAVKDAKESFGGCTPRVRAARERCLNATRSVCLERSLFMTEVFKMTEGEPTALRRAKAFKELCERGTIFIQDDELIIGNAGSSIRAGMVGPDDNYYVLSEELDTISTRPQDPFLITEAQKKAFKDIVEPYWKGKSFPDVWKARVPEELDQLSKALVINNVSRTQGGLAVVVSNYEMIIKIGTSGIRKKIDDRMPSLDASIPGHYEKIVYLQALQIVCDGIEARAKRYAALAKEKAGREKDPRRKAELEQIARICQRVPVNPATTFWEALQSLWLYHIALWMEHDMVPFCPGRFDQYMFPYLEKDIEEGRLTKEEAQELLECLWVKFAELNWFVSKDWAPFVPGYASFSNICCGGINERGEDAVNELSYMMLQATTDVRLTQPHMSVKYNKARNPDKFLRKAVELVALGTGHPPFHNDELGIRHMLDMGIPLEEAWNWSPRGCMETALAGKEGNTFQGLSEVNLAAAMELALLNGNHRFSKSRLPVPQTGDPGSFKTFAEFKAAVKKQVAFLIKKAAELSQICEALQREQRVMLVNSLTLEECIEKARDCNDGGAKYNPGSQIMISGIADISNSLAAVKELIYDKKSLTWDALLKALDKDFQGYPEIRQICLAAPKYGNDLPAVDDIVSEIARYAAEEVRSYKGAYGVRRELQTCSAGSHLAPGFHTGALPSGRKAWMPLADGASPMQGTDTRGPTAVLKSLSKCATDLYTSGTLLNMKLDPSVLRDEKGIRDFMGLIKSWVDLGLYHVQFNIVSPETLRDAQKHPEKYRGLMVRVSGYSAYFVELDKTVQDEVISRTTHQALV